jgi:hypothetical protein
MENWLREQFCNLVYFTDFSVQQISLLKKVDIETCFASPQLRIWQQFESMRL